MTKFDIDVFHDESCDPLVLGSKGQRSRSRVTKTLPCGSLHSCECWLFLVECANGCGAYVNVCRYRGVRAAKAVFTRLRQHNRQLPMFLSFGNVDVQRRSHLSRSVRHSVLLRLSIWPVIKCRQCFCVSCRYCYAVSPVHSPHQQQCRNNFVECYKLNDSFDKVECCFDIVAVNGNSVKIAWCNLQY